MFAILSPTDENIRRPRYVRWSAYAAWTWIRTGSFPRPRRARSQDRGWRRRTCSNHLLLQVKLGKCTAKAPDEDRMQVAVVTAA